MELRIKRAPRIDLEITVPGDKSISHRAVIVAALSNGVCTLRGFLPSEDCMHTVNAMRALGIKIEQPEPTTLIVHGKKTGPHRAKSGNQLRQFGHDHAASRGSAGRTKIRESAGGEIRACPNGPMDRVIAPLCEMGASVVAEGPDGYAAIAHPWRVASWNSIPPICSECTSERRTASGRSLCERQDHR